MNRILVVEDEPGIALELEDSLRLEGHEVQVISDGMTAGRCAREGAFDLIPSRGHAARQRRFYHLP